MNVTALVSLISLPIAGGVVATWLWAKRRKTSMIVARLERLVQQTQAEAAAPVTLIKKRQSAADLVGDWAEHLPGSAAYLALLSAAGAQKQVTALLAIQVALFFLPLVLAVALDFNLAAAFACALLLSFAPIMVLKMRAESRRTKLAEQLPDAVDLMVSVLRSGHSVAQAVKAVANEIADPLGEEFSQVLHRVNLGQSFAEALQASAQRFRSFELDLMRRAISIQTEVGGSLAELMESTNITLRERLKLARQLRVVTAQSRLSANIVGLLPIAVAIALNTMSPGYMQVLIDDKTGQMLLALAVVLELLGLFVMHRMSTMRA